MTTSDLTARLRTMLAEQLAVDESRIAADTLLFDDLGADSLALSELGERISTELGVDLTGVPELAYRTIGDLVGHLEKALG